MVLTAFSNTVLTVLFGLLGSILSVLRSIYNRVRGSTLSPRDFMLSAVRVPIGLVAGVCVGLAFVPSDAPIQGGRGLVGGRYLSAPTLAFLAGYGAEAVLKLFDGLLHTLFRVDDTPSASGDDTPRVRRFKA